MIATDPIPDPGQVQMLASLLDVLDLVDALDGGSFSNVQRAEFLLASDWFRDLVAERRPAG